MLKNLILINLIKLINLINVIKLVEMIAGGKVINRYVYILTRLTKLNTWTSPDCDQIETNLINLANLPGAGLP